MHGLRSRDKAVTPRESVPPIGADTGDGAVDPDIPGILDMDRREAVRRYKETPRPAGVYQVVHKSSGRVLVGTSPDAPAMLRRNRAQMEMDSYPNAQLQRDWGVSGRPVSGSRLLLSSMSPTALPKPTTRISNRGRDPRLTLPAHTQNGAQ